MARPPFDVVRAAFYLVAFVLAAHVVVVLIGVGACIFRLSEPGYKCDADGHLFELLGGALSAALAFAGGMMRGGPPPPPKE
jgi:hypothetical protein